MKVLATYRTFDDMVAEGACGPYENAANGATLSNSGQ